MSGEKVIHEWKRLDISSTYKERLVESKHEGCRPDFQYWNEATQRWIDYPSFGYHDSLINQACYLSERVKVLEEALEWAVEYIGPLGSVCPVKTCPLDYRDKCDKHNPDWKSCLLKYFRGEK